ncbi:hypothetical protein GCM10010174_03650 [Kutzneria viridogrisea]|uniref:Uncharacterized protein n=1 Tax=Kutzneria viridogrisea TaxID=47990 RepID=A0ABR6BRB8_9PSEU|nr:hypothetical protein [Kutzneria viridogrisea]
MTTDDPTRAPSPRPDLITHATSDRVHHCTRLVRDHGGCTAWHQIREILTSPGPQGIPFQDLLYPAATITAVLLTAQGVPRRYLTGQAPAIPANLSNVNLTELWEAHGHTAAILRAAQNGETRFPEQVLDHFAAHNDMAVAITADLVTALGETTRSWVRFDHDLGPAPLTAVPDPSTSGGTPGSDSSR